jgi:hypothetical protein
MAFTANFPPEARFAPTAAEIAARLAGACGCAAETADEIRAAVVAAFGAALALAAAATSGIDVTLRAGGSAFEADVACGGHSLLHCSKARTS